MGVSPMIWRGMGVSPMILHGRDATGGTPVPPW